MGTPKQELTAGYGTLAVYILMIAAAVGRLVAPFLEAGYAEALELAGAAWIAAFALFVALYLPLYLRR